ncbi:MAG: hypothetical protein J6I32_01160 [Bacteroidaceae bacterium]|nr:hypothetical protein [Bacteroidaceae bacterium]
MRSEEQGKKVASAFGKKYGKRSFCQTKIHLKKQKKATLTVGVAFANPVLITHHRRA